MENAKRAVGIITKKERQRFAAEKKKIIEYLKEMHPDKFHNMPHHELRKLVASELRLKPISAYRFANIIRDMTDMSSVNHTKPPHLSSYVRDDGTILKNWEPVNNLNKLEERLETETRFCQVKPNFSDLIELYNLANEVSGLVESLAEGQDVVQRASDLWSAIDNLHKAGRSILIVK